MYRITTTQTVGIEDDVYLISDYQKEFELLNQTTKRKVVLHIIAKQNENIKAVFSVNGKEYCVVGDKCDVAKNQPITSEDLKINFNKSDIFEVDLTSEIDKIFMPKQKLNEFRRQVLDNLKQILTNVNREYLNKVKVGKPKKVNEFVNYQFIESLQEKFTADNIVYSPCEYLLEDIKQFISLCKKQNKKAYLNLPNFALAQDVEMLSEIVDKTKISIVVNNPFALNFDAEKVIGGGLNVYNSYTANYLGLPFIKAEGGSFKMPYMTMRHCPMKANLNANCNNCPYKNGYYYVMQNGKQLKLKRIKMSSCTFLLTD